MSKAGKASQVETLAYLAPLLVTKKRSFTTLPTGVSVIKSLTTRPNKLELDLMSQPSLIFSSKAGKASQGEHSGLYVHIVSKKAKKVL